VPFSVSICKHLQAKSGSKHFGVFSASQQAFANIRANFQEYIFCCSVLQMKRNEEPGGLGKKTDRAGRIVCMVAPLMRMK
jgi:hypothetical protein